MSSRGASSSVPVHPRILGAAAHLDSAMPAKTVNPLLLPVILSQGEESLTFSTGDDEEEAEVLKELATPGPVTPQARSSTTTVTSSPLLSDTSLELAYPRSPSPPSIQNRWKTYSSVRPVSSPAYRAAIPIFASASTPIASRMVTPAFSMDALPRQAATAQAPRTPDPREATPAPLAGSSRSKTTSPAPLPMMAPVPVRVRRVKLVLGPRPPTPPPVVEVSPSPAPTSQSASGRRTGKPPPVPVPNLTRKSRGRLVPGVPLADSSHSQSNIKYPDDDKVRRHICPVSGCAKAFKRLSHLNRHVSAVHTYERPFECDVVGCGKKFNRRDNLAQHHRVHDTG